MRRAVLALAIAGLVGGPGGCDCNSSPESAGESGPEGAAASGEPSEPSPEMPPRIPPSSGEFAPSMARHVDGEFDGEAFAETEQCQSCHADQVREWGDSVHAFSSLNNPFYLVAFDEFLESEGEDKINFCGGCHDPAPMFEEKLASGLEPDDPDGHLGITCTGCHGVTAATTTGNASYELSTEPIPVPSEDGEEGLGEHLDAVSGPAEQGDALCVSCHRAFLSEETGHAAAMAGINDHTPWHQSVYAGNRISRIDDPVESQGCIDCHMPETGPEGTRSHRFAGGHSTMAAAIGSDQQLEAVRRMVQGAATIDVATVESGDGDEDQAPRTVEPGERLRFDTVIFNDRVGHRFPAGAKDLRDTFIEVTVRDADGDLVASSGRKHRKTGAGELIHRLRTLLVTEEGREVENHLVHQFRTPAFDHTVAPRDAAVVRFGWDVPDQGLEVAEPLTVRTRLLHRRLDENLADRACDNARDGRGRAFVEAGERFMETDIDPCRPQPIIEIDSTSVTVGGGGPPEWSNERPAWRRAFEHGLGLRHAVQEKLGQARRAFQRARAALDEAPDSTDRDRAQVLFMLGEVATDQGRTEEAMSHYEAAEDLVGDHPAIHFARGRALTRVFRHEEARTWFEKAREARDPDARPDDRIAALLAESFGSNFEYLDAYRTTRRGLSVEPRHPDLLRMQSRALGKLDVPDEWREAAAEAYGYYKRDQEASAFRHRCSNEDEECLLERRPVHVHELRTRVEE